jgi:hypothetical protein
MKTKSEARIRMTDGRYAAYVVQVDSDGQERVDNCYGMKFYASEKMARKQVEKYLAKIS